MKEPPDPASSTGNKPGADGRAFIDLQRMLFEAATGMAGDALSAATLSNATALDAARKAYGAAWDHASAVLETFEHRFGPAAEEEDGQDPGGRAGRRLLAGLFDPKAWLTHGLGTDAAPAAAPIAGTYEEARRFERQVSAIAAAWIELHGRHLEQDALMLGAWTRAARRFSEERDGHAGGKPGETRAAVQSWLEIANQELLATKRSDAFLAGQRRVLKASTDLRLAQRALGDAIADMLGYPTRAEMDDVHRALTDLKRDVRDLKRQLDERSGRKRVS